MPDLRKIVLGLGAGAGGAEQRPVGEVVGSQLIKRDKMFVHDEISTELLATSGAAAILVEHELRKLDPG